MSEALAIVDVPAILPAGVTRRQFRLAALLPRCETAYEALVKAGYSPKTARSDPRDIRERTGVVRATAAIEARQRDRASGIKAKTFDEIEARIDSKEASDVLLLGALKTTHEIEQSLGDQSGEPELPRAWWDRWKKRNLRRAFELGRRSARS